MRQLALASLFASSLFGFNARAAELTVHAAQPVGPVRNHTGFVHGFTDGRVPATELLDTLSVGAWRVKDFGQLVVAAPRTQHIIFVLSDAWQFRAAQGTVPACPARDWAKYEAYVREAVTFAATHSVNIALWDVWNEPDHIAFWPADCTYADLLETYTRARAVLLSVNPAAKLTGPSFADFEGRFAVEPSQGSRTVRVDVPTLVRDLATKGMRFDTLSWHENHNNPMKVPLHVDAARAAATLVDSAYAPPIDINEFNGVSTHLLPAAHLKFVEQFSLAGVSTASLACWDIASSCTPVRSYSSCWDGLDGLLTDDNASLAAPYWFYWWHSAERGERLKAESNDDWRTTALVSLDSTVPAMRLAVARFEHSAPDVVRVSVDGLTWAASAVTVRRARLEGPPRWCTAGRFDGPLTEASPAPETMPEQTVPLVDGGFSFTVASVEDLTVNFFAVVPVLADGGVVELPDPMVPPPTDAGTGNRVDPPRPCGCSVPGLPACVAVATAVLLRRRARG